MLLKKSMVAEPVIQKQFYCIKMSFLEAKNFKMMYDNSLKLNKAYETYAQTIQNYFRSFHEYCSHIKQPSQQRIQFLYEFKRYLFDYSRIMAKITDYQISCFQANRQTNSEQSLSMALFQLVQNAKKYSPFQKQIRQKKQALTKQFTAIKSQYMTISKKMKKPKYYYDKKYMRAQFQPLRSKISSNQKGQQQILSQVIKINQNTSNYFAQVNYFRKQLLKNKYRYHKKLLDLAINSKESLAELFFYQYNCLNDYYQRINAAMNKQDDQFSMLRLQKSYKTLAADPTSCMTLVIKNTEDYLRLIQSIQNDLKITEKNFQMINKRLKLYQQKGLTKTSFQNINKFFQADQSPSQTILQTIDAFDYCFRKLAEKQIDCKTAAENIQNIRKQITRHKGITISLLKVKLNNAGSQTARSFASQNQINNQCGVYQFMNSLDLKPVKLVIKVCLDKMLYTFNQILAYFNQRTNSSKKLGIADSMDLSYMEKSLLQVKKKKPVKDQLWLWDQYKKKIDTQFTLSKDLFQQFLTILDSFKDDGQLNLDLQKYSCFCETLQQSGELSLSKKYIKFTSKQSERQICIPLSDIEQVKRKTKIVIQDSIFIKTKLGQLVFRQFQNSANVQQTLKQLIQSGGGSKAKIQKRQKVQLTDAQKTKLQSQARIQEVQKIRPNIAEFQQVFTKTFENFPIDQFYDLILSDKKFSLTGKQHDSFLVYAMKKYKNKDFKITKFEPPGPKYYTLEQNVTFQNGPIVSECKFEYNHLLDIPFLPSQCSNNQTRKVFWINDKELDYLIHSQTIGVPMSDNFYVELVYKVKQENQNTNLKVYAQIKFLKSFALKSTVESSTWKQIKDGTRDTVAQMEKGINLYKTLLSGKTVEQQQQPDESDISRKQLQKLKKRNIYLMIAVIVIVVLNIIIKLFF